MKRIVTIIAVLAVLGLIIIPQIFFSVDETQMAIVTRFGEPLRSFTKPGLKIKTPFVEQVIYLDKRLLVFDAPPDSLLTKDKKRLIIDIYSRGLITDPLKVVETVRDETGGANRAIEIVASELRREIGLDNQSEIIKTSRESIMDNVEVAVRPKLKEFGIDVVDVRIKRADFPNEIASSVHQRMASERKRKADKERAEGAQIDLEVRADVDKKATIIISVATRDADIIIGCGEAEAIKIFADALEQDPEFYTFQRSLEIYATYLTENTTIVGSAEDLGLMFENIRRGVASAATIPSVDAQDTLATSAGVAALGSSCAEVAARQLLASQLSVETIDLQVMDINPANWTDSSLGCAVEGSFYVAIPQSGFELAFDYNGDLYRIHSNTFGSQVINCIN